MKLSKSLAPFRRRTERWQSPLFKLGHDRLPCHLIDLLLLFARHAVLLVLSFPYSFHTKAHK